MRAGSPIGWLLLAGASAWATVAAWRGPEPTVPPPTPPPLPRPPTPAERDALDRARAAVLERLRGGPAPPAEALESTRPDGSPWLPGGLPDNPLVPGVGGVIQRCPARVLAGDAVDWVYCPEPLEFLPVVPGSTTENR